MASPAEPFEYVAWFEDERLPQEDQDREWPAVFLVVAASGDAAKAWGDHLARKRASSLGDGCFLRSSVEPHICGVAVSEGQPHNQCPNYAKGPLPVVADRQDGVDEHIGW